MSPSKNKNYAASVRQRLLNYARSSGQDFIIDFVKSFLWPPIDSITKTKLFEMTWYAGGPWLD